MKDWSRTGCNRLRSPRSALPRTDNECPIRRKRIISQPAVGADQGRRGEQVAQMPFQTGGTILKPEAIDIDAGETRRGQLLNHLVRSEAGDHPLPAIAFAPAHGAVGPAQSARVQVSAQ